MIVFFVQNHAELSKEVGGKISRRLGTEKNERLAFENVRFFVQISPKLTKGYREKKFILNFLFSGGRNSLVFRLLPEGEQHSFPHEP